MDRSTHYQVLIKEVLTRYAELLVKGFPPIPYDVTLAFDDQHQQYVLRKLGWVENDRIRHTILHLTLKQGKIWIEEDWTEEGSATYLLEHGVPHADIVLGFQHPAMRPYTEFAVA